MMNLSRLVALSALAGSGFVAAADAPTLRSGEYEVTTSFGDSQALVKKVCLSSYAEWYESLRSDFNERGCNLSAQQRDDGVYVYRLDCANGAGGTLAVTRVDDSNFVSEAQIQLPIAGYTQTISTRDDARRLGDCPPE